MRRWLGLIMIVTLVVLSACAAPAASPAAPAEQGAAAPASEGTAASDTTGAASGEQVTITYAIWDNNQLPAHEKIIEAFEAQHPNINVEPQVVPWGDYWTKLQTAVAGGEAYDTFWMNGPSFPVYAGKGVLMDLQPMIDADGVDMTKYPESLVNLYSYDGSAYGLPKDFDTIGLFYNKDLFDKAGVAYPDATWTWDNLTEAAKKLTDPAEGVWGFASTLEDQSNYWNFIYQNGGQVISEDGSKVLLDDPADCEALQYAYSFVAERKFARRRNHGLNRPIYPAFPGRQGGDDHGGFMDGQALCRVGSQDRRRTAAQGQAERHDYPWLEQRDLVRHEASAGSVGVGQIPGQRGSGQDPGRVRHGDPRLRGYAGRVGQVGAEHEFADVHRRAGLCRTVSDGSTGYGVERQGSRSADRSLDGQHAARQHVCRCGCGGQCRVESAVGYR